MRSGLQPSKSHYQMAAAAAASASNNNTSFSSNPYVNNIYNHHKYQTLENTLTRQGSTNSKQRLAASGGTVVATPPASTPPSRPLIQQDEAASPMNSQSFTTMVKLPPVVDSMGSLPEFPRHKLRVLEKLGEGAFGMVSAFFAFSRKYGTCGQSESVWTRTTVRYTSETPIIRHAHHYYSDFELSS